MYIEESLLVSDVCKLVDNENLIMLCTQYSYMLWNSSL